MILNNVESIINELTDKVPYVAKMEKFDGISIEITLTQKSKFDTVKEKLTSICKDLGILPIDVHMNNNSDKTFLLEFPDLNVLYSDEEKEKLYKDSFKWLLDLSIKNSVNVQVTRTTIINAKDSFVKQAIQIYCKSNINPYKENVETDYLNNVEYRKNIDSLFYTYANTYCAENNIG